MECVCGVWCVSVCKLLCQCTVCVGRVIVQRCGVCVCVQCCEWVSVCVFVFCLVVLSFVHVQSGIGVHGVSVVVCHNIEQTHTMNTNTTLHMKTFTTPSILIFRTKQTSGGSKVKNTLVFYNTE